MNKSGVFTSLGMQVFFHFLIGLIFFQFIEGKESECGLNFYFVHVDRLVWCETVLVCTNHTTEGLLSQSALKDKNWIDNDPGSFWCLRVKIKLEPYGVVKIFLKHSSTCIFPWNVSAIHTSVSLIVKLNTANRSITMIIGFGYSLCS